MPNEPAAPSSDLDCPECGAPLCLAADQTWAICAYCNASLRLKLADGALRAEQVPEVPAEVVEEVKELLQQGARTRALDLYAKRAGIEAGEAEAAMEALLTAIRYQPPLNTIGLVMLATAVAAFVAGVAVGVWFTAGGQSMLGVALIAGSVLLARLNWRSLFGNLGMTALYYWGRPARATIQKCWHVAEKRAGKDTHFQITRLLLNVEPQGEAAFQAETTCIVGQQSQAKFQAGAEVWVKYDRQKENVVVTGAAQPTAPK